MTIREQLVTEAKKLIGVPYLHYGRSDKGLDCFGFLWLVYHKCGIDFASFDGRSYGRHWYVRTDIFGERYLNGLFDRGFSLVDSPLPGDVLLFKMFGKNVAINHSGIVIEYVDDFNLYFIHSSGIRAQRGLCVKREFILPSYRKWFVCYLRHEKVN